MTVEKALERLEEINGSLSSGEVTVDGAVALYAEAASLLKECAKMLERAREAVERASEGTVDGE